MLPALAGGTAGSVAPPNFRELASSSRAHARFGLVGFAVRASDGDEQTRSGDPRPPARIAFCGGARRLAGDYPAARGSSTGIVGLEPNLPPPSTRAWISNTCSGAGVLQLSRRMLVAKNIF